MQGQTIPEHKRRLPALFHKRKMFSYCFRFDNDSTPRDHSGIYHDLLVFQFGFSPTNRCNITWANRPDNKILLQLHDVKDKKIYAIGTVTIGRIYNIKMILNKRDGYIKIRTTSHSHITLYEIKHAKAIAKLASYGAVIYPQDEFIQVVETHTR